MPAGGPRAAYLRRRLFCYTPTVSRAPAQRPTAMKSESGNRNLRAARAAKNDEFYTQRADIEAELFYYRKYFAGKVVYCNCDDPTVSHFYAYFRDNFKFLKLRKVIVATYRNPDPNAHRGQTDLIAEAEEKYALKQAEKKNKESPPIKRKQAVCVEYTGDKTGRPRTMRGDGWYHGGDFRSKESIALLKQADIVCTNPPFSLFREYVAQLVEYKKDFLILGNMNAVTYKEIFPLLKNNRVWLGVSISSGDREFGVPTHYPLTAASSRTDESGNKFIRVKGVRWFTNLDNQKRHADLRKRLYRKYDPAKYPKYENYDAIDVSKVDDIPLNYSGVMGVPISFMDKYNPDQFEILGADYDVRQGLLPELVNPAWEGKLDRGYINGRRQYSRILIRHKHPRD